MTDFTNPNEVRKLQEHYESLPEFTTNVHDCLHCGQYHEDIHFVRLKTPADDGAGNKITHVSECPATGLQLKITFRHPEFVAQKEIATRMAEATEKLKVDGLSDQDVERVLLALRNRGASN